MDETDAKYAAMTEDELLDALLLNELTGLKGRRSFVIEIEFAKHVVSIDADSLDWFNDNISKDAHEELLCQVAQALLDEFGPDYSYNLYDEKFYVLSDGGWTSGQLEEGMLKVRSRLACAAIERTTPNGRVVTKTGLDVDLVWAIADNKGDADEALMTKKAARKSRGERPGIAHGHDAGAQAEPQAVVKLKVTLPAYEGTSMYEQLDPME